MTEFAQVCPDCGRAFPRHTEECYHFDCDAGFMALHGCGVDVGMPVVVNDPQHFSSEHDHQFTGTVVDICLLPSCNGVTVVDQDDNSFWITFDELLGINNE